MNIFKFIIRPLGSYLILVICASSLAYAQKNDRYVVYFSDKNNSEFSVEEPKDYLSDRAIERRNKMNISIVENDLPVNHSYINGVSDLVNDVLYSSKWFNAVLIEMDVDSYEEVLSLPYVTQIEYVSPAKVDNGGVTIERPPQITQKNVINQIDNNLQNRMIGIDKLHNQGYFGKDIMIAFVDSGFEGISNLSSFNHLYKNQTILDQYNFVSNSENIENGSGHGTSVLSTVAAYLQPNYTGIAYQASFVLYVSEDSDTEYKVEEYYFLMAAEKSDELGVDIINVSLGYSDFDDPEMNYSYQDLDGETAIITRAAEIAYSKGILVVCSAGNSGNSEWRYVTPPADGKNVLSVGSVDEEGNKSIFSSLGLDNVNYFKPDVMALGSSAVVIKLDGNISNANGTSFSAPMIAGLAALYLEKNPSFSNSDLLNYIRTSGHQYMKPDYNYGFGIPNYKNEIVLNDEFKPFLDISIYPIPFNNQLNIVLNDKKIKNIKVIDFLGNILYYKDFNISNKNTFSFNTQDWNSGIYTIYLETSNMEYYYQKIIKTN